MTQEDKKLLLKALCEEEKELLLKVLCAMLPYGVKCLVNFNDGTKDIMTLKTGLPNSFGKWDFYNEKYSVCSDNFKPYLRPMSSMTEEEQKVFVGFHCVNLCPIIMDSCLTINNEASMLDWLNKNHFDYRGLIEKGLALEATKENNPYKK